MEKKQNNQNESGKKRNYKKAIILAIIGFSLFSAHVFMAKGSSDFIVKLLHGDIIYVANMVMTTFVLGGWFFVYKYLGRYL